MPGVNGCLPGRFRKSGWLMALIRPGCASLHKNTWVRQFFPMSACYAPLLTGTLLAYTLNTHGWEDTLQSKTRVCTERRAPQWKKVHQQEGAGAWTKTGANRNGSAASWIYQYAAQLGYWYFSAMVRVVDFNLHKPQSVHDQWVRQTGLSYQTDK